MKPAPISLESLRELGDPYLQRRIPEEWRDSNGHMNVRWYLVIFDDAGDVLHERMALTPEYHRATMTGTFDLEHHINYLSEVLPGEDVSVYVRYVAASEKRLQYQMFLVNESRGKLSALFECMNAFADLQSRKLAAFPEESARRIRLQVEKHARISWPAPVCGAMRP